MSDTTSNQLLVTFARVLKAHAEIVSGAYKQRKSSQMDSSQPDGWRPHTDDEKLHNVMGVMDNHIKFMQDILDHFMEEEHKSQFPAEDEDELNYTGIG